MTQIVVVSPHLDDAIFSASEMICTWLHEEADVTLATVYGGVPLHDPAGKAKHIEMHREHEKACQILGVRHRFTTLLDDVYEPRPSVIDVEAAVMHLIEGADIVIGPTGIHHPDHQRVAATMANIGAWRYDELPYYVEYPHQAFRPGSDYVQVTPTAGWLTRKQAACRAYRSQVRDKEERCLWAPERIWRPR